MTDTLADLEAQAAKAAAAYQNAQEAAEQARRAEQDRQAARARQLDEQYVAAYDDEQMGQQLRDARRHLAEVFVASDIGQAWVALQAATLRRAHASAEHAGALHRLGRPETSVSRPADNTAVELLARLIDEGAEAVIAAELDELEDARQAYIEGRD